MGEVPNDCGFGQGGGRCHLSALPGFLVRAIKWGSTERSASLLGKDKAEAEHGVGVSHSVVPTPLWERKGTALPIWRAGGRHSQDLDSGEREDPSHDARPRVMASQVGSH